MGKAKKVNKLIDLSGLPRSQSGKKIQWTQAIGCSLPFIYGEYQGTLKIIEKVSEKKYKVIIDIGTEKIEYTLNISDLYACKLGGAFFKPIAKTNPDLIKYFVNKEDTYKYGPHSMIMVDMICPICGTKKKQYISVLTRSGFGCPSCSDGISYPNKFMYHVLKQTGIKFINELTKKYNGFEWVGDYRYDFYFELNNVKYIIEMDGKFHDGSVYVDEETAKQTDLIKDKLAVEHGIDLIRIDCRYKDLSKRFDTVKTNLLNSTLSNIIDLSTIDWRDAHIHSIATIIQSVADLWNLGALGTTDIGAELGIARCTVREYLKIATELGLCDYNEEERKRRTKIKVAPDRYKKRVPLIILKNDIVIGVFSGIIVLDKLSLKLYGYHLDFRNIHTAMKHPNMSLCGYTFQRITKKQYEQYKLQQTIPVYEQY